MNLNLMSTSIRNNISNIRGKVEFAVKNVIANVFSHSTLLIHPTQCKNSLKSPKIVAVSKYKPVDNIIEAYNCGIRYFGENYVMLKYRSATFTHFLTGQRIRDQIER